MAGNPFPITRRQALGSAAALAGAALAAGGRPAEAAAAMQGPLRPDLYRVKIGDFEVTSILDGAVQVDGPHPIFGENQPKEAVQAFATENLLPPEKMEISFTPIVVNTGSQIILFDTGNGMGRRPGTGALFSRLAGSGIQPSQVDIVVLTHFHGDHIGGLMRDGQLVFPNARFFAGEAEYAAWTAPEMASGARADNAKLVQANVVPLKDRITFLKPEQEVASGITAVDAFGHTPGMLAFRIDSGGKQLLIWADVTNHWVMSLERPDWHVRFDMDKEAAAQTRKRIFDMVSADRIPVTGYHMPFPSFGYVQKKKDGGYGWVQATYQLHL